MSDHDQIWPYLHGELSKEERSEFEEALKKNDVLRQAMKERKVTDALMREAAKDADNEPFVDVLLNKWEAEHSEFRENPANSSARIIKLGIPLATAAAAMFVLLSAPWRHVHWERTVLGENPQLRNDSDVDPFYSRSDLKRAAKLIRQAIESEVSNNPKPANKWSLKIHIQEVNDGNLLVEVSGHPENNSSSSRVWKSDFQSLETLQDHTRVLAAEIANDLAP